MTTTTHPALMPTVVEPVELVSTRTAVLPAPLTAPSAPLPTRVLALDLVGAGSAAVVSHLLLGTWSPAVSAVVPPLWLALVAACGGYAIVPGSRRVGRSRALVRAATGLGLLLWVVTALAPGLLGVDAATAAQAGLALTFLCLASATAVRRFAPRPATRTTRVVVAGDSTGVQSLLREIERGAAGTNFEPVAVCLSDHELVDDSAFPDLPIWHGLTQVVDVVHASAPDAVVVVPGPELDHDELRRLSAHLQGVDTALLVSAGLRDVAEARLELGSAGGMRLLHVRPAAAAGPTRILKELVDRLGAAALLVLLAPVIAVVAVLIRLDSPGAAIFRQVRVGRDGEHFTLWKLRTMSADAERVVDELDAVNEYDPDGLLFKIRRDPRITRLGAVLRKYSLDELPQLVNVVRGEMSLIGPRPALPSEVRAYSPELRRRLAVKPGMTGLWQVSGRSDLPWEETVRLDLMYVDNWSWSLDASIAVQTLGAVAGHRGAY